MIDYTCLLHEYITETENILCSSPPKYRQYCIKCGNCLYILCSDYGIVSNLVEDIKNERKDDQEELAS